MISRAPSLLQCLNDGRHLFFLFIKSFQNFICVFFSEFLAKHRLNSMGIGHVPKVLEKIPVLFLLCPIMIIARGHIKSQFTYKKITIFGGMLSAVQPTILIDINFSWSLGYIRKPVFGPPWRNYFAPGFVCS